MVDVRTCLGVRFIGVSGSSGVGWGTALMRFELKTPELRKQRRTYEWWGSTSRPEQPRGWERDTESELGIEVCFRTGVDRCLVVLSTCTRQFSG